MINAAKSELQASAPHYKSTEAWIQALERQDTPPAPLSPRQKKAKTPRKDKENIVRRFFAKPSTTPSSPATPSTEHDVSVRFTKKYVWLSIFNCLFRSTLLLNSQNHRRPNYTRRNRRQSHTSDRRRNLCATSARPCRARCSAVPVCDAMRCVSRMWSRLSLSLIFSCWRIWLVRYVVVDLLMFLLLLMFISKMYIGILHSDYVAVRIFSSNSLEVWNKFCFF